jgi:anaerobic magnesium-protoporphyrin IX monomethyl ester cyclase
MRLGLIAAVDESRPMRAIVQKMCPPLGLKYIESYLHDRMPDVEVMVTYSRAELLRFFPDVAGISSVTENMLLAAQIARQMKALLGTPVIMGGSHLSLLPDSLPESVDVGVIGEGEETVGELLGLLRAEGRLAPDRLAAVRGIIFRHPSRGMVCTQARMPLPIDSLPFPERRRRDEAGYTHVVTSRGCPHGCTFCASPRIMRPFRHHSAEYVVRELAAVKDQVNPPFVKFFDDLFTADPERLRRISKMIKTQGVCFERGYGCFARSNLLDTDTIIILKELGVSLVSIGVESGSSHILDLVGKGTTVIQNQRALDLCAGAGMNVVCSFILGVPGETEHDLDATLAFIDGNRDKISQIEVCPVVPYPGTPLWEYASGRGLVSAVMDWSLLRDHSVFAEFVPDDYIYLNEEMDRAVFARYCEEFRRAYVRFCRMRSAFRD